MSAYAYFEYLTVGEDRLFTVVVLPEREGTFPTVIMRSPYVKAASGRAEDELVQQALETYSSYSRRGYAVVFQHCKGCGKSTGAFVPYIHEREDGIFLREWIRKQSFYNGELLLVGGSYTASLHFATAPFPKDVIGAVLEVQDSQRYNLWYRNGQMRKGHANWHFDLYKNNLPLKKSFNMSSFAQLPLAGLSQRVLSDRAEDFEQMLAARFPDDGFWHTRYGGVEARDAVFDAGIPILLATGYNDFYVGGIFKMWDKMNEETKSKSALLVSPYDHGDGYSRGIAFPYGKRTERFGDEYKLDWLDNLRCGSHINHEKGVITYYRAFDGRWESDFYKTPTEILELDMGEGEGSFLYDPLSPTAFAPEGCFANEENDRGSFIRTYTLPLERDVFVKGQMRAVLSVRSNRADTSFYVRISIKKADCTYVLRHDITSLSYQLGDYRENDEVKLEFTFDEHAFLLKQGECLQIDIASTDDNTYVSHTNNKGEYALQTKAKSAINTVNLCSSKLLLPVEI